MSTPATGGRVAANGELVPEPLSTLEGAGSKYSSESPSVADEPETVEGGVVVLMLGAG